MFFPIGDDQVKGGHKPLFAYSLILVNVIIFFYEFSLGPELSQIFVTEFGAIPFEILSGTDWHTLFTCMFLHGGWMHLIGNMLFLWVFADNIEAVIGNINFLIFYTVGGLAASAVHVFFNPYSEIPMVGASGAISAVMGAYLIMFPASRIKVLILIFFTVVYVPAIFFLGIWIVQQMVAGYGSLNAVSEESTGVAWWAHIGGFVFGVVAGFLARSQYRSKYKYHTED
ncbi:MAG: rhomboid family intramembrane serine protease [Saprospiraceae bacterium]|nr:rhomboid family intramembrane serine protease [Saprospiraceae bacterium]MBK7810538.1 rhomboid family intramembrane serine protease [Saprospiraceae bacterium]MBK9630127.1 rhomboid family intramembrane serine protease [Saprospiraceae bacterium]